MARENQEILDRFVAGVKAASDNAAYIENTTDEGGVRNMEREIEYSEYDKPVSRADIDTIHDIGKNKGKLSVNQFTSKELQATQKWAHKFYQQLGAKSPFFRAWFGDWREHDNTLVNVAKDLGSKRGTVKNNDTGWNINVSRKIFNETNSHNAQKNIKTQKYLPFINSIIENAVLLDTFVSDKYDSQDSLFMHSFYAIADIGNGEELLKLYVEELNNVNTSDNTHRAYQLQDIEKQQLGVTGSKSKTFSRITQAADVKTISDLHAFVKQQDKDFKPKPASKVVDGEGKPLVVYHGSGESFDEFDITKSRSWDLTPGLDLPGFYFSENPEEAGSYGEGIKEYYLSIANPYEGNVAVLAKEKGSYRAAYEYLVAEGYDGMIVDDMGEGYREFIAFSPEQIKSVDNIGTFGSENPKYRFDSRDGDLFDDEDILFSEYDDIADVVKRQYTTHSEAIGEVLRNTAGLFMQSA